MLDKIFSPKFKQVLTADNPDTTNIEIDNLHRDLIELLIAGIYTLEKRHILWVVGENENLDERKTKLELWLKLFAQDEAFIHFYTTPFEDPYINNEDKARAIGHKAQLIARLLEEKRLIVITTLAALNIKIETRTKLRDFFLKLDLDQTLNRDELIKKLAEMGYRSRDIVEEPGDISWRGSIVDVFPIDARYPVRAEIEGDTLVSLRIFNPDTQKSLEKIRTIRFPLSRYFLNHETSTAYFNGEKERMVYLTELLGEDLRDRRIVVSDQKKVTDEFRKLLLNYENIYDAAANEENPQKKPALIFDFFLEREPLTSINETWDDIAAPREWERLKKSLMDLNLEDLQHLSTRVKHHGYRLYIFSKGEDPGQRLAESIPTYTHVPGKIPFSFENPGTRCIFLADREFQYLEKIEKASQLKSEALIKEIQINDLVVHREHGIGRFIGFKRLAFTDPGATTYLGGGRRPFTDGLGKITNQTDFSSESEELREAPANNSVSREMARRAFLGGGRRPPPQVTEFLQIEYLNREYLYVPVYNLDVLTKYISFEGYMPQMDRLGGNTWALKKKRAKKSMIIFARELLDLYAMRKAIKGNAYVKEYEMEEKLAEGFQYVETEDQKKSIDDVLKDLEADYPMDRLICGDVSFGKTEVALRAALRVAANGKQVAILCPTTILAYQHYNTFKQRLAQFPITIAMLSRMVLPKKRKTLHNDIAKGKIDIIIGTHALLSKNIEFKRLGLYIIDEEQRFGVFQKEKLKQNREDIDVMSMSATPIPRTLSLSMVGLYDISNIQTPPLGRMAIKNFVGYYSREIIVSAVLNERERNGSVFIIYNNIDRIYSFKEEFQQWLPQVPAVVIHAQMKNEEIETNLMAFIGKKYRVLISTTIIENGIDIPDVNTLIVLEANRFGLTQLYQLRGRIGRGNRQAYAYFLVRTMDITEKAKARLEGIREFAELGAGYKLAEYDLKLRGAGSLLGNRQHGHIEALGFDYYHQMLAKTIKELKGEIHKEKESRINIHFSYSIDANYIKNTGERIALYRQVLEAETFERLEEIRGELEDRCGRPPDSIEKIFFAGMVRVFAKANRLEEVDLYLDKLVVKLPDQGKGMPALIEKIQPSGAVSEIKIIAETERIWAFHFTDYKAFIREVASGGQGAFL